MTRWVKRAVVGVLGVIVLAFAAIFIYANFINDAPDELTTTDLAEALLDTTAPTGEQPATTEARDDTELGPNDFDGDWATTTGSEFGYRVEEVLAGVNTTAVGRSSDIDGLLTIDATMATAVDVTVVVDTIRSDDPTRDGQFAGRIMNTAEFPTAEFHLTEPIDFGRVPVGDEQLTATATGELTLRGVTNPVTFDVTVQATNGRIGVLGSIPVVFGDYGIDNPSFGVVKTEDDGLVEFVLVFEPA